MSKRMPVLLALVVGVLGGALIGGSALLGVSASAAPAPASSATAVATASTAKSCGWRLRYMTPKLRADLKAARALPKGERRPAVRKIVRAARAGHYGKRVQRLAKLRHRHHVAVQKLLPADFKADLKKARHLPAGPERKAALKKIRKDALAGDYGSYAKKVPNGARHTGLRARRAGAPATDGRGHS